MALYISGFQIKTCTTNGGKDECEKCQEGYIQLNNISSFNMNDTSCFVSPNYQCPISKYNLITLIPHLQMECIISVCKRTSKSIVPNSCCRVGSM